MMIVLNRLSVPIIIIGLMFVGGWTFIVVNAIIEASEPDNSNLYKQIDELEDDNYLLRLSLNEAIELLRVNDDAMTKLKSGCDICLQYYKNIKWQFEQCLVSRHECCKE